MALLQNRQSQLKIRTGPSGVHIFDRRTGLNLLLDEVNVPESSWDCAPRQVSVALTNACDLACPYCYAPKFPAAVCSDRVVNWLTELDAHGCLGVGFGGGEPTLYRDFSGLCRQVAKSTGLAVTFTTHAHWLDDKFAASLAGSVHFVRVSMDGVGRTYESLRGRSFETLRKRLETVRALSRFGINFVVNRHTFADLDAATALAAEVGATDFLLLPEQPTNATSGIDTGTAESLRRWVWSYRGTVRLSVSEAGGDGLPTCHPLPAEVGLSAYVHIDAAGTLKRSSYDSDGVSIGCEGVMSALEVLRSREERGQ